MDTARLKELIELMNRHQLEELEIEDDGFRARLKKKGEKEVVAMPGIMPGVAAAMPAASGAPAAAAPQVDESQLIPSPLVGTFYRSPSPEADSFVEVGDRIEPDQVLCIVEAMKVMNEVKSDRSGVIEEILVENGESVEFSTPLFRIA
ncbi:MAG: acetyl-CoA carboxylase biotin carboxyl carrier protein [Planctomycetota bacterium]